MKNVDETLRASNGWSLWGGMWGGRPALTKEQEIRTVFGSLLEEPRSSYASPEPFAPGIFPPS